MMQQKKCTLLWLGAGFLFCLLVFLVVFTGLSGKTIIADPAGVPEAADTVMNCIRSGSWETLSPMVSGCPSLAPGTGEADSAGQAIWEAYQDSLQWTCQKDLELQNGHVTLTVTVTCLDIPGVTSAMASMLADSQVSADEPENAAQILRSAAEQVLKDVTPVAEHEITLTFLRENGRWMVVPNRAFQSLLSGFTA